MNPVEQAILIGSTASEQLQTKYAKGQEEHGGDFFDKPTVKNIREEVLDLIAYTHVLSNHKVILVNKLKLLACRASPDLGFYFSEVIKLAEDL